MDNLSVLFPLESIPLLLPSQHSRSLVESLTFRLPSVPLTPPLSPAPLPRMLLLFEENPTRSEGGMISFA